MVQSLCLFFWSAPPDLSERTLVFLDETFCFLVIYASGWCLSLFPFVRPIEEFKSNATHITCYLFFPCTIRFILRAICMIISTLFRLDTQYSNGFSWYFRFDDFIITSSGSNLTFVYYFP